MVRTLFLGMIKSVCGLPICLATDHGAIDVLHFSYDKDIDGWFLLGFMLSPNPDSLFNKQDHLDLTWILDLGLK